MCYDSTLQERRTAWRQTSSSTPPPPPRGLMPDRPPLGSPTGPRRDATRSSREWPTNPALAVCIPHSTNAVCTTRENGIQQPPTAVLAEDWIGFDPHRQRIDHTAPAHVSYAAPTTSSPRHTSEGASWLNNYSIICRKCNNEQIYAEYEKQKCQEKRIVFHYF